MAVQCMLHAVVICLTPTINTITSGHCVNSAVNVGPYIYLLAKTLYLSAGRELDFCDTVPFIVVLPKQPMLHQQLLPRLMFSFIIL